MGIRWTQTYGRKSATIRWPLSKYRPGSMPSRRTPNLQLLSAAGYTDIRWIHTAQVPTGIQSDTKVSRLQNHLAANDIKCGVILCSWYQR
jgi:hypothetical protein